MLSVYKKCEKSVDNPYGIIEIKELDRPFLMCISAQGQMDKSVFGIIKEGARAARVRTSDEYAAGYKIDEMPIDFLGIKYMSETLKDAKHNNLVNDYIYPFLMKDKDLNSIKKRARLMNFFTYCNGAQIYLTMEKRLKEKLLADGISEEDTKDILSQIGVVSIASEIDLTKAHATSILFKDANDIDVMDQTSRIALKKIEEMGRECLIGSLKSNTNAIGYLYNGYGIHELKQYLKDESTVKSSLCATVSTLLQNSIQNYNSQRLIPISSKELLKVIVRNNSEFIGNEEMLKRLDSSINYGKTTKYTIEEDALLKQLDKAYKELAKVQGELNRTKDTLKEEQYKTRTLINGIADKCSDVAFSQIVVANRMWNGSKQDMANMNKPTDREIREEYEKSLEDRPKTL